MNVRVETKTNTIYNRIDIYEKVWEIQRTKDEIILKFDDHYCIRLLRTEVENISVEV